MQGTKDCHVGVRLSLEERRKLERLARSSGLGTLSAVLARLIAEADAIVPPRVLTRRERLHTEEERVHA